MSICFIISHRYYRNYTSYIKYYIDNIIKFYENPLILVIDNNSKYISDIIEILKDYLEVKILINDTDCKFEIGAYKVGINYLMDNNLIQKYDFYVFSQDTYVIKNKYDFNNLVNNNITATAFYAYTSLPTSLKFGYFYSPISKKIIDNLNFDPKNREYDIINTFNLCSCCSFVLHYLKITEFLDIVKDVVITTRFESECSERFLSPILYRLNNNKISEISNELLQPYNVYTVNIIDDNVPNFFIKKFQQKNENTEDI